MGIRTRSSGSKSLGSLGWRLLIVKMKQLRENIIEGVTSEEYIATVLNVREPANIPLVDGFWEIMAICCFWLREMISTVT